jgi:hypothetical protein
MWSLCRGHGQGVMVPHDHVIWARWFGTVPAGMAIWSTLVLTSRPNDACDLFA